MRTYDNKRRAQFFSVTVFLFIMLFLSLFSYFTFFSEKEEEFNNERLEGFVISNFMESFEIVYLPQILKASVKPSLSAYLQEKDEPVSYVELVDIMEDGILDGDNILDSNEFTTNSMFSRAISLVTFEGSSTNIKYTIVDTEMISDDRIRMTFKVDYKFNFASRKWMRDDLYIDIIFDVYSLRHTYHDEIIDEDWVHSDGCLLVYLFDGSHSCVNNLAPPVIPV